MIAFLKGMLAGKTAACAYIDVQGVGYARRHVPRRAFEAAGGGRACASAHVSAGVR